MILVNPDNGVLYTLTIQCRLKIYQKFNNKSYISSNSQKKYSTFSEKKYSECPNCKEKATSKCDCIYIDLQCNNKHVWYTDEIGDIQIGDPHLILSNNNWKQ